MTFPCSLKQMVPAKNLSKLQPHHEPPIPEFTDTVIVVAGLSALGKPLTDEFVHRAEIFSQLSGLQINQPITPDALIRMFSHIHKAD